MQKPSKLAQIPQIRFAGFTQPWEIRKLEDCMETITDYVAAGSFANIASNVKYKNTPDYAQLIRTIDLKYKFNNNDFVYVDKKAFNYLWRVNLNTECIILPNIGNIGEVYYVEPSSLPYKHNVLGPNAIYLKSVHNVKFIYSLFQATDFQNKLLTCSTSSGRSKFNKTELKEIQIILPNLQEQQKIGELFANLDNLITLHQRKCDTLKKVKKSMLQKMFPKNGASIPEIRFAGFTGDWERRKLGEVATEILAGGDIDKNKVVEKGIYPIYANALTNDGIVGYYDDYYKIKAPAVTVTGRGEVGYAKARFVDFTPVVRLISIRSNHDCYFLENAINNHKVVVESTGVPQLTVPQLSLYDIYFPKDLKEEEKIGTYFQSLDNLITLHQRKVEKLKKIKAAMLSKAFI